jgi:tRNA A-37 threonylcarbamoyl transferase component Bud32/membrane-associated phospholipid phosphatase
MTDPAATTARPPAAASAAPVPTLRRRPSGEPPPLPRRIERSTAAFLVLAGATLVLWFTLAFDPARRAVTAVDLAVLRAFASLRADWLTSLVRHVDDLGSVWVFRSLAWASLLVLLVLRRFQRLVTLLVVLLVVASTQALVSVELGRMRPTEIEMLAGWSGYAHPSRPVTLLGLGVAAALFALVPRGRWRDRLAVVGAVAVVAVALARLYLGVDHPTDVVAAVVLGALVPPIVFRLVTPDDVFPVRYRSGQRAHLDVTGARGAAIHAALERQLGLQVRAVEPFAVSASAGSTPLRLCLGGPDEGRVLFGKLYAVQHLRSDRWYKLARTVRYGRLEDERPFNTVRRLVEYEDHMLRLMHDAGLPTPQPYGFVEITPEREYVLVTEFFDGAARLSDSTVDDDVIDSGLRAVRGLWDAGLAHRDIKPANLLVRGREVLVIDVAFGAARPTPWRQAVDLANMLLSLALGSTAERVYRRAVAQFSPDDVAEAFAACRSVTIPSELRARLRADGRDLHAQFCALAPSRPPVPIQRWTFRRAALTVGVVAGATAVLALVVLNLRLSGLV